MTVNEMHIAVNLGVQKIASFQVDNLLPQEIDHELNLAMMRFIKQRFSMTSNRVGKGFEQSQKRIDDLRSLLVEHTGSTTTEGQVYTSNYSNVYVDRYTLPLDYLFLVSVRPFVQYACNTDITSLITAPPITKRAVRVDLTPPAAGYVLVGMTRSTPSGSQENIINLPSGQEITTDLLFDSGNYNFGIIPSDTFNQSTSNFTAQQTPNLGSNDLYLINPVTFWYTLPWVLRTEWRIPNSTAPVQYKYNNELESFRTANRSYPAGKTLLTLASFGQHDDILYMMDDPFNKSWYKEPTYTIEGNSIDIYTDNEFVVPKVTIKYIRKPLEISINNGSPSPNTNGTGCELPIHTHHEIVEMTIKSILEGIQDPRYQTQSMETLESE
jgi:hypothetical protein